MKKEKSYGWRAGLVGIAAILLSATMTVQLIRLQHTYKPVASGGIFGVKTSTYTYPLTAARGEIYDRYNRPLVVNKEELVLRLDYGRLARSGDQNGVLLRLTKLLAEQNIAWPDTLPLGKDGLYYTEEWSE
jgi:cell division protein FtsI/penicillin-binding protein 2